ncbi:MAG: hypothetical protein WC390_06745 [Sulfurimonas sp.]|jgi:hypothetical protein
MIKTPADIHKLIDIWKINNAGDSAPTAIHLGPQDSIDFVRNIDVFLAGMQEGHVEKIKTDLLITGEFPNNIEICGVKVLFSQLVRTIVY